MASHEYLTAKIYTDGLSTNISPEVGYLGIDLVSAYAAIVPDTETGRLMPAGWNERYINVDRVAVPNFSADINILLTGRMLVKNNQLTDSGVVKKTRANSDNHLIGYSIITGNRSKKRFAMVDVGGIEQADVVVAHEVGHLLDLSLDENSDNHCVDTSCVMVRSLHDESNHWDFCTNCAQQVEYQAAELSARKHSVRFILNRTFGWQ